MRVLRVGMNGDDVTRWQNFLVGRGAYHGEVDGNFGPATHQATIDFQRQLGLTADGVVGDKSFGAAMQLGFPVTEDPTNQEEGGPNWPPPPAGVFPLVNNAQRQALFGTFTYVPAPTAWNREAIKITNSWQKDNVVMVDVPQLARLGFPKVAFHKAVAHQLQGFFQDVENAGLLDLVLTWDGSYAPRFVRGSTQYLSNHCLPASETVWTTEGPTSIADLKGYNGTVWSYQDGIAVPGKVTNFFDNGRKPILRISARGHTLHCTPNHPVLVLRKQTLTKAEWVPHKIGRGSQRALYWTEMVRADELKRGDRIVAVRRLPERPSTNDPELDWAEIVGLFIGDGCIHHLHGKAEYVGFCFPDEDRVRSHVTELLTHYFSESPKSSSRALYFYKEWIFQQFLPFDRPAISKRIPTEVWSWSHAAKVRFLLGVLYSDGWVQRSPSSSGTGVGAPCAFKMASKGLIEDLSMLMTELGFRTTRITYTPPEDKVIKGVLTRTKGAWSVRGTDVLGVLRPDADPMYLERVLAAPTPDQGNTPCWGYDVLMPNFTHHFVEKVEYVRDDTVYDIEVDQHHNFISNGLVVSNSYATAFDINAAWNGLGTRGPLVGQKGSIRKLVPIALSWGFYSGLWFGRTDPMHFEVFKII